MLPTTCKGTAAWPALAESLTVKVTGTCVGPEVQGAVGEMVTLALQVRLAVTLNGPVAPKMDTNLDNATVLPGVPEKTTVLEPVAVGLRAVAPDGLQVVIAVGALPMTLAVTNTGLVKLQEPFPMGVHAPKETL